MKVIAKKLITLFLVFICTVVVGYAQNTLRISDTICYEIKESKIILSVKLNGKSTKFILDTGGVNLITRDSALKHNVQVTAQQAVADVNSKNSLFYKGAMNNLQLSERINLSTTDVLIIPPQPYFDGLGVAGALGGEAFADVCLTFHAKENMIVLTHPYRPQGVSRKEGMPMNMGSSYHSIFPLNIGGQTIKALFDTGMDGFLHLSNDDYEHLKQTVPIECLAVGEGIWHVGVGGVNDVDTEKISKVVVPEITVVGKKFRQVGSLTSSSPQTIIGRELLDYGTVILDYPRGLFYFYPFEPEGVINEVDLKVWNVNILPMIDHFEITGIIGKTDGFKIGDRVWGINGIDLESFPLDQVRIIQLMNEIKAPTASLLVGETKESARKVIIRKL